MSCLSLELETLLLQSKTRWLKTNEIYTLLLNIPTTNLKQMALNKLPYHPNSGDVFIINGDTQFKKWKSDGFNYLARKNGIGFREDIEKLKIGGIKEIFVYYSYVIQPNYLQGSNSNEVIMNRRIYRLINNSRVDNQYFMVHYLKEHSCLPPLLNINNNPANSEITEDKNTQETRSIPTFSPSDHGESPMYESSNYVPIRFYSKEEEEMIISEQEFIEMGDKPQSNNYDFCQDFLNFEENLDPSLSLPPFFEPQVTNQEIIVKKPFIQTEQTDNGHFQVLQNRILELEARIHDLEFEKQSVSLQNNTNSTVSNSLFSVIQNNNNNSFDYKIKINDFSPEWDFVEGGSKMMICFSPIQMILTEDQNNKLSVLFGDIEVKAFCIQPGVIKCYVPPHVKGFVKLSVFYNKDRIDDCLDKSSMFEYRKNIKAKRKNKETIEELLLDKEDTRKISHDFKIRIIEKLSNFHQNLTINSNHHNKASQDKIFKLEEIPKVLSDFLLDSKEFDVSSFISIFTLIMEQAALLGYATETIGNLLNELNSDGFALIHYLILINFYETIPLLVKYNIDLNISSKGGITPLQVAIAFNYDNSVEMLIKQGVINPDNIESLLQNNTNKKLMDQNIASLDVLFKNSHILDMIMREITLQDSINNSNSIHTDKFSCNNQDDQEDNYFNILELLNEMEDKFVVHSDEETKNRMKEKKFENNLLENEKNNLKKHKYLKFHGKKNKKDGKKKDFQGQVSSNELKNKEVYASHQDHIRTIQKNVRGWLLRRQYLDIKYAARVLQNYIRGKLAKKQMCPEYKLLIKNKLKDWLNLKC